MTDDLTVRADAIIDAWSATGLEAIELPSGYAVRVRKPEPKDVIVRGILPADLVDAVIAYVGSGASWDDVGEKDPAFAIKLASTMANVAADMVRQIRAPGTDAWVPADLDVERFTMLPDGDKQALLAIANAAISGEADGGPGDDALRTFRGAGTGGLGLGQDRRKVRNTAIRPRRDKPAVGGAKVRPRRRGASGAR
jgi:hypothetical protein